MVRRESRARRGSHLSGAPFRGTWARSLGEALLQLLTNSDGEAAQVLKLGSSGSLAVTEGILVSFFSSNLLRYASAQWVDPHAP